MIILIIGILLALIFSVHDYKIERKINLNLLIRISIRILSTIGSSIIFYYLINQSFSVSKSINQILVISSLLLNTNIIICLIEKSKEKFSKLYFTILKIILIVVTLELTLFNYQNYLTLFNNPRTIKDYELVNLKEVGDKYIPIKEGKVGFKINLDNNDLKSIYFPIRSQKSSLVSYNIKILEKETNGYVSYGNPKVYSDVAKSNYKIINHTIETDTIYLEIIDTEDTVFSLDKIVLNPKIPINFSLIRVVLIISIIILFIFFSPTSRIYQIKLDSNSGKKIIAIFSCFIICLIAILANINPVFKKNNSYRYLSPLTSINEYQSLTESLLEGKFYLKEKPSDILNKMKNPYNSYMRTKLFYDSKDNYLWDVAYYEGRYYVYFGIVPVITTYLPYYLVTGSHIDNNVVNIIALAVITLSFLGLLKQVMTKYFKNNNLGMFLLLASFGLLANHFMILYAARRPDFYTIPIVYGIMFSLLGLNCWLKSIKKDNHLDKKYLALGSLCMALVSGCRPQLLLISFSSIIIFWESFRKKKIFSKKSIPETICFLLPYIIIALLVMYYNYARFGSILDFGANYNLTTNDMTARGFQFERFFPAIYYYFLAPSKFTNIFPFIETIPISTSYVGITIYENTFGGTFTLCPVLLISIFFYKFKNYFKSKMLYLLSGFFMISAIIIPLADSQMAGILPRYFIDFNWLLILSTIFILLSILEKYKKNENIIIKYFSIITVLLIIFNIFLCFIDVSFSYRVILPSLFYHFYYLIQFWL